ncbi:26029_t:CDS:2 [Gigaspora margarita]|uniref:26029_t:CDS:1 n=1 Tax=Gigaspora margarita TaxID=4874 RepID=A0ABN7VAP5_GIGMA|nr:26029_t:CDS:2 [Gigaspora margarita]
MPRLRNTSRLLRKDGDPTKELNNFFEILIEDLQKQIKKLNNKTKHLQNLIIKNKNEYNCNIQNLQLEKIVIQNESNHNFKITLDENDSNFTIRILDNDDD